MRSYLSVRLLCCLTLLLQGSIYGESWAILKGGKLPLPEAYNYDLLAIGGRHFSLMEIFAHRKTRVVGILNLSVVDKESPYFERLKDQKALLSINEARGFALVNTASKDYAKIVIEEIVPKYLFDRFKGLYIKADDRSEGVPLLIRSIRYHYPEVLLYVEASPEIIAETAGHIDGAVVSALESYYNPQEGKYALRDEKASDSEYAAIKAIMQKNPKLKYFSLDFWDTKDVAGMHAIARKQQERGFSSYVTDYKMDKLITVSR